jgi:hypothetical protein
MTTGAGNPLLGVWKLVRWEIAYDDGRPPSYPFGPDASGLILYTHDGAMSACIARSGRQPLSSASVRSAPEVERLAAFESYFQYAGTYEIQPRDEPVGGGAGQGGLQVVHRVSHSLNPNFVGTAQVRRMDFDADGTLTLSASDLIPGTRALRHHRLIWKR